MDSTRRRGWPAWPLTAVLALAASCTSTPGDDDRELGGGGDDAGDVAELTQSGTTYDVPDPLPDAESGTLLAQRAEGTANNLDATRTTVLYLSRNSRGEPVAVSGVVLIPDATPPADGWPVVSWAHGTTGVANRCAPSQLPSVVYESARTYLEAGYAVVATDYIGLGTPGTHTYMNDADQGRAVADIVPAARDAVPDLGSTWFAAGHSQGGAAALSATRAAEPPAATVAFAPGNSLDTGFERIIAGDEPNPRRLVFGLLVLLGVEASDPGFDLGRVLGPAGADLIEQAREKCVFDLDVPEADIERMLEVDPADVAEISAVLADYGNPDEEPVNGPVMVVQGDADIVVPAAGTEAMVARLRDLGSEVTDVVLPGLDHIEILAAAECTALTFLAEHGGNDATC